MFLTCPQCATRYQADEAKFPPAGRTVRCGKCRHQWHQPGFAVDPQPCAVASAELMSEANISGATLSAAALTPPTAASKQPLLRAMDEGRPMPLRLAPVALAAAWVALIAILLLAALLANHYREDIAIVWPHSLSPQPSASRQMEMQGIELRNVGYRREIDDSQTMLVISGTIANSADRELPVPKTIRVTLSDSNNNELFSAAVSSPTLATLGPGQSVTFHTQIHDLPSADLHLKMRLDD